MINNFFIKEGVKPLLYFFLAILFSALFLCGFLALLFAVITISIAYIYRQPSKNILTYENNIVSPCDGIVTAIDTKGEKQTIYITVRCCDTHLLKAPIAAKMKLSKVRHGVHLNANTFKAKQLNEQIIVKFNKIKITLLSSTFNCTMKVDEFKEYQQTERFGVMIQGEVKVTLPKQVKSSVTLGQKVIASKSILA